jgi:hypothetical protein
MQTDHFGSVTLAVTDNLVSLPMPEALANLSKAKLVAARQAEFTYHAVNANVDGQQHYFVETGDDHSTYTLPAGDYATFKMTRANRLALDQFTGQAYGKIAQAGYRPAGNYNLETLSDAMFTVQTPVVKA